MIAKLLTFIKLLYIERTNKWVYKILKINIAAKTVMANREITSASAAIPRALVHMELSAWPVCLETCISSTYCFLHMYGISPEANTTAMKSSRASQHMHHVAKPQLFGRRVIDLARLAVCSS